MDFYIELFGYLGSTLVVVSMLMASVVRLRILNTVGSVISATYAFIIGSFPLVLMNVCIIVINLYGLFRLLRPRNTYSLVPGKAQDGFVDYFLRRNGEDIRRYFPGFDADTHRDEDAYLICCEGVPAGVLLAKHTGDALDISLDYTTPTYRDCSVGAFLYGNLKVLGIRTLRFAHPGSQQHGAYLERMGFRKEEGVYTKAL